MKKSIVGGIVMAATVAASAAPLGELDAALARIGAAVARGDQAALAAAFEDGFGAGLTLALVP